MNTIPYPGKAFGKKKAYELANQMMDEIAKLDRAELEALILTCKQFTNTNCGWMEYEAKQAIINLAKSRLDMITPINQKVLNRHS